MEVYNNKNAKAEIKEDDIIFKYDYTLDVYKTTITIENKNLSISLSPDYDTNDFSQSLDTFRKIKSDFKNFYNNTLKRCSKEITALANIWNEEDPSHIITAEEISSRIDSPNLILDIALKDYTFFFNDDNIFLGHTIMCGGNIETGEFETTLAG